MTEKIAFGLISFIIVLQIILTLAIIYSNAYNAVKKHIIGDEPWKKDIGNLKGIGIVPFGGIQKTSNSEGDTGNATISLIIKGDKKYIDATIYLEKQLNRSEWDIIRIETY